LAGNSSRLIYNSLSSWNISWEEKPKKVMSQYTREEVINKVKAGESLKDADLTGIDLSKVDFSPLEYGGTC
jgi:hypothetical protein